MSLVGGSFEEIEHTADWAIRVTAPTLEALFAAAARGMFSLLRAEDVDEPGRRVSEESAPSELAPGQPAPRQPAPGDAAPGRTPSAGASIEAAARVRSLRLAAVDAETLLIDWLNELLFLSEDESILFHAFAVDVETADNGVSLDAEAHAAPAGRLEKTIKAATFSGLSIESQESSWSATIVFDV